MSLAIGVAVASLGACGDDAPAELPAGAAARVGDVVITESQVVRHLKATMNQQDFNPEGQWPPRYRDCMAHKRRVMPTRTERNLLRQCAFEFEAKRADAVQFLVRAQWVEREAGRRGLRPNLREPVQEPIEQTPGPRFTRAELARQFEVANLDEQLADATVVPEQTIAGFYRRHIEQFTHPEQREVRFVQAPTRTAAQRARRELERGVPWPDVVNRYSDDAKSREAGGRVTLLAGYLRGQPAGRLFFSASEDILTGPRRAGNAWYLFRVDKVVPANRDSLDDARAGIEGLLRQQELTFVLAERYGTDTLCARRYRRTIVPECLDDPASIKFK